MDSMNLKDFRPDRLNFDMEKKALANSDSEIQASAYHQEINTLKIDKLSNRVTIISIIIPFLIGAIVIFAYMDMKKRVVDVDLTKKSQVERISQQLEEKLNALDVKIAKNKFDLDNTLPELTQKAISLEGHIAKLTSTKADTHTIEEQFIAKDLFEKLEKRVANNSKQDKSILQTMERINKQTSSSIQESQTLFDKAARKIKDEITLFKEEFDARLLELSEYDQQIGELRKDTSLLDKKYKALEQETISQRMVDEKTIEIKTELSSRIKDLDKKIETLDKKLNTNISRLQNDIDHVLKPSLQDSKPRPQIRIDSSESVNIKEESLSQ